MTSLSNELNIGKIYEKVSTRKPSLGLGLKYDPFPPTGITSSSESLGSFYLAPQIQRKLANFVEEAIQGRDFCGLVVLGDYGSGKTALLKYFEYRVSEASGQGLPLAAYYVSNPGTNFADVLQAMTNSIGRDVLRKYAWAFTLEQLQKGYEKSDTYLEDMNLVDAPTGQISNMLDSHDFWKLFHDSLGLETTQLASAVSSIMHDALSDHALAEDLSKLMLGTRSAASQTWSHLTRPLPATSIKKPVANERLDGLLSVLESNGIEHVFLLIDEFEDVVYQRMTRKLRDDFVATLRNLIGAHGRILSIVFASNISGWGLLLHSDEGLKQRFNFEIELGELTASEISAIVNRYITPAISAHSQAASKFFSNETIQLVLERSRALARPMLSMLHKLTEHFWDATKTPTLEEIKNYLETGASGSSS